MPLPFLEALFLRFAVKRFLKENPQMLDFFKKFFSANSIMSRLARAISLVVSYIAGLGHTPNTLNEWIAALTAFLGGLIAAGQNNPAPVKGTPPPPVDPKA